MTTPFKLNVFPTGSPSRGDYIEATQYAVVTNATTVQVSVSGKCLGDYLSHVVVCPLSSANNAFTVFDGTTVVCATTNTITAAAVQLVPVCVHMGIVATSSKGFNVTAGSGVSVTCVGRFTGAVNP